MQGIFQFVKMLPNIHLLHLNNIELNKVALGDIDSPGGDSDGIGKLLEGQSILQSVLQILVLLIVGLPRCFPTITPHSFPKLRILELSKSSKNSVISSFFNLIGNLTVLTVHLDIDL